MHALITRSGARSWVEARDVQDQSVQGQPPEIIIVIFGGTVAVFEINPRVLSRVKLPANTEACACESSAGTLRMTWRSCSGSWTRTTRARSGGRLRSEGWLARGSKTGFGLPRALAEVGQRPGSGGARAPERHPPPRSRRAGQRAVDSIEPESLQRFRQRIPACGKRQGNQRFPYGKRQDEALSGKEIIMC